MLSDKKLKAFIPTAKPAEAKAFYKDILGLNLLSEDDYAIEFEANDTLLRITIMREFTPQMFTALGWDVTDIYSVIEGLNKKGVVFEKYSFLQQDDAGVWTAPNDIKVAWFKDPDGNVLSLSQ